MNNQQTDRQIWWILALICTAKLALHLVFNANWTYHRDELLYLALGNHPDWGYWSNPTSIGAVSWLVQRTIGDSVWALRLVPSLLGTGLVLVAGLTARELKGGPWAVGMAAGSLALSVAYLRTSTYFMPVIFDVFYWTLLLYLVIRYLNTRREQLFWWIGLVIGLAILNKYSIGFLLLGLLGGLLLSSERKLLTQRGPYWALGLGLLIALPNLAWQVALDFPVVDHLQGLVRNQLSNNSVRDFLLEQLLFNLTAILIWTFGLVWLLSYRKARPYRVVGYTYLVVLLLMVLLRAKGYYTMGLYPPLLAAGAVAWESLAKSRRWLAYALPVVMVASVLPITPLALPLLSPPRMAQYGEQVLTKIGLGQALRWEDGERRALPQDYADMLAWEEFPQLVRRAIDRLPAGTGYLIYAENYGQAGAVNRYRRFYQLPEAVSFADNFRLWAPPELPANTQALIYINDEVGEDMEQLFGRVELVGTITHPQARERGTGVYLCTEPRSDVAAFWRERRASVSRFYRR
jgi:4-amino-4-deoxy-L-arabinose transferase-like glycosyltransferase